MSDAVAASEKKNVAVLAACQALLFTNNSTLIALNGLAGYALAADKSLATLPVTGWVVGAVLTTFFASLLMKRIGRRAGFTLGACIGIVGAAICSIALWRADFWLLCTGTTVFGVYNAFGQYYRFAAADAATPDFKSRAISYVMAGGLVGGIIGPATSRVTVDILPTTYLGAYLFLIGVLVLVIVLLRFLDIPAPAQTEAHERGRPLAEIAAQPAFVVAVLTAALAYGVMNLLMTATPLAMGVCGHPYAAAATVISSHVVAMFAPSFVTGDLIRRFGVLNVMLSGVTITLACLAIALAGVAVAHFWWSLVLLGVGWNFVFIGATTLLTETYRPAEKAKVQGANDLLIFLTTATSSFSSGMILERNGWQTLNYAAIPFVAAIGIAVIWLMTKRRRAVAVA
ncbi:MAG TPA: MFS transporter [Burkholderiales bacterium]|nr:MFS transporter [Burkholderiales bacterium]